MKSIFEGQNIQLLNSTLQYAVSAVAATRRAVHSRLSTPKQRLDPSPWLSPVSVLYGDGREPGSDSIRAKYLEGRAMVVGGKKGLQGKAS